VITRRRYHGVPGEVPNEKDACGAHLRHRFGRCRRWVRIQLEQELGSINDNLGTSYGTAAAKSEIPVGVIGSFSGPEASSVGIGKPTIQAWADYVNANGGIDGHQVHLYIFDDQGNAQTSVTDVKTLVEQDHVVAIVGQAAAPGDATWASYIEQSGVPVVGGTSNDAIYMSNPDYFAAGGNSLSDFYGIAQLASKAGPKTGSCTALNYRTVPASFLCSRDSGLPWACRFHLHQLSPVPRRTTQQPARVSSQPG